MSQNTEALSRGYEAALCNYLQAAGGTAVGALAYSALGGPAISVPTAVAIAGISAMAYAHNCSWDPEGPSSIPPGTSNIVPGSCLEATECQLWLTDVHGTQWNGSKVRKLNYIVDDGFYPNGTPRVKYSYINCDGEEVINTGSGNDMPVSTEVKNGASCVGDPAPEPPPEQFVHQYTDNVTNCTNNFALEGFVTTPNGEWNPVFTVSQAEELPEGGGSTKNTTTKPTTGCSFNNIVIYKRPSFGGGDDPPIIIPPGGDGGGGGGGDDPGPDDEPWWLGPLKDFLPYLAYNTLMAVAEALSSQYPEQTWELVAPCQKDDEGNPAKATFPIPGGGFNRTVMDKLDALQANTQVALSWKTPICEPEPTPVEGDFRTISFRSDETSPYGKSRLRKRLRYRSVSGIGLNDLVDYWKDFTFEAGPVVVGHVGGPWGSPQVWASSEAEGKRVLQHAAGEAGFDPDQVGEWRIGSSNSARYGVSGTMRVDTTGGFYWITARDGASERPMVAKASDL